MNAGNRGVFAPAPARQCGISLLITLILLVAMSMMAATLITSSTIRERIVGVFRNIDIAFEAAEAGLRDAETDLMTVRLPSGDTTLAATAGCTSTGACLSSDSSGTPKWESANWTASSTNTVAYGSQTSAAALPAVAQPPRYLIEVIPTTAGTSLKGKPCYAYRMTSRGLGGDSTAVAMVQSTAYYASLCR